MCSVVNISWPYVTHNTSVNAFFSQWKMNEIFDAVVTRYPWYHMRYLHLIIWHLLSIIRLSNSPFVLLMHHSLSYLRHPTHPVLSSFLLFQKGHQEMGIFNELWWLPRLLPLAPVKVDTKTMKCILQSAPILYLINSYICSDIIIIAGLYSMCQYRPQKVTDSAIYYDLIYRLWSSSDVSKCLLRLDKMSMADDFCQSYAISSCVIRHFMVCGFKVSRADWLHVNFKSLNHNWSYLASMISAAWMNATWTRGCCTYQDKTHNFPEWF